MTFDERVTALRPFGFSAIQTRFLVTFALHGGFCLRRQYAEFAGLKYGAGVREFLERLVARGLARHVTFRRDRGAVVHIHSSAIYDAIGQHENRNRRHASSAHIARKLMLLDYVLEHPSRDWLATEEDKVEFFTTRCSVPHAALPRRVYRGQNSTRTVRHFIHKQPIVVTEDPRTVSFVYLTTDANGHAFATFLEDHRKLFAALSRWQVVAVASRHVPGLPACERAFQRFQAQPGPAAPSAAELLEYFRLRRLVEREELAGVSVDQINFFRTTRDRHASPAMDFAYGDWTRTGQLSNAALASLAPRPTSRDGGLILHQLARAYDRFGSFPGVC
jgi:hypothetical protein